MAFDINKTPFLLRDKYKSENPIDIGASVPEVSREPNVAAPDGPMSDEEFLQAEIEDDKALEQINALKDIENSDIQESKDLLKKAAENYKEPMSEEGLKIQSEESSDLDKLRRLRDDFIKKQNKKNEGFDWDRLPDILAGIHNIDTYARGVSDRKELPMNYYDTQQAKKEKQRQSELTDMANLLKLQSAYRDFQNPDSKASYKVAGNSIFKIAPGKPPEFMAKDPSAATEAEKEYDKKMVGDLIEQSQYEQKALEKSQLIDETIRTYQKVLLEYKRPDLLERLTFGKYKDLEGGAQQKLDSQLKKLDIMDMVQTFAGMSKAIDSDQEQKRWQATVASLKNNQPANMDILLRGKELALRYNAHIADKRRYLQKNRTFVGYKPKKYEVLYSPTGQTIVVDSNQRKHVDKSYMSREEFAKKDFRKVQYLGGATDNDAIRENTINGVLNDNIEKLKSQGVELTPERIENLKKKIEEKLEAAGKI